MRLVLVLLLSLALVATSATVVGEAETKANDLAQVSCLVKKGMKVYGLARKVFDAYEKFLDSTTIGQAFKATREARYNFVMACYNELNQILDKYLDGYKRPVAQC